MSARSSRLGTGLALLAGGAASITLMACYGAPPLQACKYVGADGGTQSNGTLCRNGCVSPEEANRLGSDCFGVSDAGPSDGGADAGADGGTDGGVDGGP